MLIFADDRLAASASIAVQSRGKHWYAEIKKSAKRVVIRGSAVIDRETEKVKITLYGSNAGQERVLTEEFYHIVFEVIRLSSSKTFASLRKWYSNRLSKLFNTQICRFDDIFFAEYYRLVKITAKISVVSDYGWVEPNISMDYMSQRFAPKLAPKGYYRPSFGAREHFGQRHKFLIDSY